ncbi:HlyD family secretion protein [Paraglaciecola arctica]|uniref:HlyD family secretion protein n=1 Tax=Paraglaciecola arctica BSs20135 TaxID=493475 RepID=K6Y0D1_9ALTE|nr:HlyD family efflux transporter periplasmic adaptor subunit [Paraglaciecola arctica]GAC17331.1 HlyD family secretion protein [Paraglaciecola arctica BSs20135]
MKNLIEITNIKYVIVILTTLLACLGCEDDSPSLALGTLERDRIAHTATANEVVVALPIARGARVNVGDVLVQLDNRQQSALTVKAQAYVAEAQANLEKYRNGARPEEVAAASAKLQGAKAALTESDAAYLRAKNLLAKGLVSQASLDQALASKDSNSAAVQAAQEELLILTNGTRHEDLLMAAANLAVMQAALASENKKLEDLTVTATRDGLLDNLPWNLGERVTLGSPVAIVLAGHTPYARIYVPEPYRIKIKAGDDLIIHVDGLAKTITGKVRWISSEPAFTPYYALNQEERARLMYLAEVQLPDSYAELPNGVAVQVELP